MQTYINALSYEIWEAIVNGYTTPSIPSIDPIDNKLYESDSKAKNAIMCGLVKIIGCKSTKEIWDILKSIQ